MNTNYTKMLEKTMPWTNAQVRNFQGPLEYYSVFNSFEAASAYALTGDVSYEGQVIAVIENGKTTVYVLDSASATGLKPVGSSTWQIFGSEVDAVAYLSSDDAKAGEVVSLSTATGYDIYKLNDLSGETFAKAYEKIIAHTDLTAALASYVQRTEISALSSLDKDTVDRLVEIASDLDSVLSTKVEESVFNTTVESLQEAIELSAEETLKSAKEYTDEISVNITTEYGEADEALHTIVTGEIVTAKTEAISTANEYTDNAISALDYPGVEKDVDSSEFGGVYIVDNVTQTDGKIDVTGKRLRVSENYFALSASPTGKLATISDVNTKVESLGRVLNFKGIVSSLPLELDDYNIGDVVIVSNDDLSTTVEWVVVEDPTLSAKTWVEIGNESSHIIKGAVLSGSDFTGNLPQTRIEGLTNDLATINGNINNLQLSANGLVEISASHDGRISGLESTVDLLQVISGDHDDRLDDLETNVTELEDTVSIISGLHDEHLAELNNIASEISSKVDNKIYVDDQLDGESGYVETLNIHKVNNEQYAEALKAGVTSADLYIVNDDHLDAYGQTIVNVATPENDTDAANKVYVDEAIANATPETATNTSKGIVQGTTNSNSVAVNADGTMSVNNITVNKIVDSIEFTLVLDGGSATGQNSAS